MIVMGDTDYYKNISIKESTERSEAGSGEEVNVFLLIFHYCYFINFNIIIPA